MCGIAGLVRFDGGPVDRRQLARMAATMVHRGPDGGGTWVSGAVGFAHRRLSIIDLGGSEQPMGSADGRLHLTYNGELLNYRDVRARTPYPYRTAGDTEVVLALHATHGPDGIHQARGQFAYGLHDASLRTLWLVRDRLGIVPLYWWSDERLLAFASEIKALLAVLPRPRLDEDSVADYLMRRSVAAPHTLYEGVRKLPPGHRLVVHEDGDVVEEAWWTLPYDDVTQPLTDAEAVARVESGLARSVQRALVADVPVGAYLSGGLDSSLTVALATRLRGREPVRTFTAGFGDPRTDELVHARRVSEHLHTDHHEITVTGADFEALWSRLSWHRDAPLSEPADVAVHRLAIAAREHVRVVLSGEGSDELFGGYPKYRLARLGALLGTVPAEVRARIAAAAERRLDGRGRRARIALRALAAPDELARLDEWFAPFGPAERRALLGGHAPGPRRWDAQRVPQGDAVRRMGLIDCGPWLSDNLLERGDRMTMAASVELRPPFLDHGLVDLAWRLPSRCKVRGGRTKWVVKEVARNHLPAEIVDRPKVGFRVPLDVWFRGSLRTLAHDLLLANGSLATSIFDRSTVVSLLERHDRAASDEAIRIWTLLSLEVWHGASADHPTAPTIGAPA
jgi:asparagine synthase (glutamine-hydrolysing)